MEKKLKLKQNSRTAFWNLGAVVEAFWNLGALVEAQETYDGFLMWKFNIQKKDIGYIKIRSTCRAWIGRRSKPGFYKKDGNVFPGFPQEAMSHADIICCAFTENRTARVHSQNNQFLYILFSHERRRKQSTNHGLSAGLR